MADRRTRLGERGVDIRVRGDIDLAEHAAEFAGDGATFFFVEIEQRERKGKRNAPQILARRSIEGAKEFYSSPMSALA